MNKYIIGIVAPSCVGAAEKVVKGLDILEQLADKESFSYFLGEKNRPVNIENRRDWISEQLRNSGHLSLVNGNEDALSSISINQPLSQQTKDLHSIIGIELFAPAWSSVNFFKLCAELGDAFDAYELTIQPPETNNIPHLQVFFQNKKRNTPYDLPGLPDVQMISAEPYNLPMAFTWINYWSPKLCYYAEINFEDAKKKFFKVEKSPNGALVIQLTETPLNLENSAHLNLLKNAYKRFAKVGGRHLLPEAN